jgi:hypothetical protein
LPRGVVDHLVPQQHLLAALRDHAQAQAVDAMEGLGRRPAPVERERGNGGSVVAVGLGKTFDCPREPCNGGAAALFRINCLFMRDFPPVLRLSKRTPDPASNEHR